MRFAAHLTDDPGGKSESTDSVPQFHDDIPHRPIVSITNSNIPKVQLTPEFSFPYQADTLILFKALMNDAQSIGVNGHARVAAMNGGLLQYPAGRQAEGTPVRLYPIFLANAEDAPAVEAKILAVQEKVAERVQGAVFHGFVANPQRTIYDMESERSQREHALRMGLPHLYIADEATTTNGDQHATVEVRHEQPADGTEEIREVESDA